ncbi:MAG TPA: DUF3303 family protein [Candidatus Polarisedimenticolaceae bacterium]|nr:DUF3303 family protein [Candidatus Polarisedimenticolaceae bacterium]
MLFVVVERFRPGKADEVYRRFRERGRMAPADVRYVASWVDLGYERCFQVMEAADESRLAEWMRHWTDLVDFEVIPVRTSEDAAAAVLPIACTLAPGELAARGDALLPGLIAKASSHEPLADGVRLRFDAKDGVLAQIAAVVEAEHRCCAFLRFEIRVQPGDGPILLDVTGPPGTKDFLGGLR